MALTKCKECGNEISTKADACPKCGAKVLRTSGCAKIVLVFLLLGGVVAFFANQSPDRAKPEATAVRNSAAVQSAATPTRQAWQYSNEKDSMSGRAIKEAVISSDNEVNFDFPYRGAQRGDLHVRIHPRYRRNVAINIDKGQFLCRVDGCNVTVRFDEGKPQTFSAAEPSDHSSTTLFITNYDRFVAQLKRAHKVSIEAEFFQQGTRVFEFSVDGLVW